MADANTAGPDSVTSLHESLRMRVWLTLEHAQREDIQLGISFVVHDSDAIKDEMLLNAPRRVS